MLLYDKLVIIEVKRQAMKRLVSIFVLLFFSISAKCGDNSCRNLEFEEHVKDIMQKYDAVGVSVVLVKNNKINYYKSFGYNPNYSNPQLRDSIKITDISWIASISKTFIATAIMQLVEKGYLALDDDVNKYLDFRISNPYYPDKTITIRMLLCHISSLNGQKTCDNFDELSPKYNVNYKDFYCDYAPGSNYSYCNIGYNLLGAIIEKVSGLRFDDYLDKYILSPLNLYGGYDVTKLDSSRFVRTMYFHKETHKFLKVTKLYSYDKFKLDHYVLGHSTPYLYPPGGMKISAIDLSKFMLMHMNKGRMKGCKRIISKKSENEMRKVQNGKSYGLALAHYKTIIRDVELVGMTGGSKGIHSAMVFHPKKKYGFVVICNGCTSESTNGIQMNREIVNEMYNCFIK